MANTRFRQIAHVLKLIGFYLPVTIYFALFAAAALLGYFWLGRVTSIPDSSYKAILQLLLSLALLIGSGILCLGIFTVCFAFVFFKWKQRKKGTTIRINTARSGEDRQEVSLYIHPILRPLLGYIRIRLNYDRVRYSRKFDLVTQRRGRLITTTLEGQYRWDLPEIRQYRIESVLIYFEDFFQFFSFVVRLPATSVFYTPPGARQVNKVEAFPRKTEEQSVRIEELKKVEGEYINYKNFEDSDDVRRIVWKIYAKNKELVVRIPEILDPYASHIYLYASFYSKFRTEGSHVLEVPFLNYYKTMCWSLYKQLGKKGIEVRFIPDQPIQQHSIPEEERVKHAITLSSWQRENELKQYVSARDTAIVLLSSLSDPEQVKELIDRYGNSITFVYVPLSESLDNLDFTHWLQWVFVQQKEDKTAAYRSAWRLSPLRLQIEQNEKQLTSLLKEHQTLAMKE